MKHAPPALPGIGLQSVLAPLPRRRMPSQRGNLARIALLALTALGCRSAEVSHSRVDPELASFVSPDAVMLAGIRMEEVRATPLYQKLMSRQKLDQMDRFAAETGFDPRKDVRDLLVASDGKRTTVVARGRFDQIKVKNATRSTYGGYTLYNGGEGGVALISRSIAVAGNIDAVKAAIDRNKAGIGSQTGLIARAEQVPASAQAWLVSNGWGFLFSGGLPETGNAANIGRIVRSLDAMTAYADLRNGLNATVIGTCKSNEDAKSLGDAVRGLIGMGRLSVPENRPEMLRLYDGLKVDQQQGTIRITADVPQNLLDQLVDMTGTRPIATRPSGPSASGSRRQGSTPRPR